MIIGRAARAVKQESVLKIGDYFSRLATIAWSSLEDLVKIIELTRLTVPLSRVSHLGRCGFRAIGFRAGQRRSPARGVVWWTASVQFDEQINFT